MKIDQRLMGFITTFENVTRANVKDCFFDKNEVLVFVVNFGDFGKAIGKKGANVKKIAYALKKRIKIIEFNPDAIEFIRNCLQPLNINEIAKEDNKITIKCANTQERAMVLGRDKQNLKALKELVGKFFDSEILVK